jgi:hypothetical protein
LIVKIIIIITIIIIDVIWRRFAAPSPHDVNMPVDSYIVEKRTLRIDRQMCERGVQQANITRRHERKTRETRRDEEEKRKENNLGEFQSTAGMVNPAEAYVRP